MMYEADPKEIIARFRNLSDHRLEQALSRVRPSQREFLQLLPLLLHINHPLLPGYVSKDAPAGIMSYEPKQAELQAASRLTKSFQYRKPGRCQLVALYAMGSVGTMAQTSGSDFDMWLCHDPALTPKDLGQLQQKATAIEQAAERLQLEVHFFLINPDTYRLGEVLELSSESSGSAQYHLLLDEFYRTAILVAGQFPAWWLVPPEEGHNYAEYVGRLKERRFVFSKDMVDFGGLDTIPAGEIFGASVWQLSKAIDSPYKSMIKLLLIEIYVSEYPQMELLSVRFKKAIYSGAIDLKHMDRLDPYHMLMQRLEDYLIAIGDHVRLELIRHCFYFKLHIPLSQPPQRNMEAQWKQLNRMTTTWGWQRHDLRLLDERETWRVPQVTRERQILFEALSDSYRFLSGFARTVTAESHISQRDLSILGRKLFAAYERRAGKVELINRGIGSNIYEPRVSVHATPDDEGGFTWGLYADYVDDASRTTMVPLKQSRSPVDLLAWGYFNGVVNKASTMAVFSKHPSLNEVVVSRIIDRFNYIFPQRVASHHDINDFIDKVALVASQFFVNIGIDSVTGFSLAQYEAEGRASEPLSYGFAHENLLKRLDLVLTNSWGEVQINRYFGDEGLAEALCSYLNWFTAGRTHLIKSPGFLAFEISRGTSITHRLDELFEGVVGFFQGCRWQPHYHYVVGVGSRCFSLGIVGESLQYQMLPDSAALLQQLSRLHPHFAQTTFDRYALMDSPLSAIYPLNRPDLIQLFYQRRGSDEVDLYILDERGTLFNRTIPFKSEDILINHFSNFFEAVINRIRNLAGNDGKESGIPGGLEFYRIERGAIDHFKLTRRPPNFFSNGLRYTSLQVIVEAGEDGRPTFTFYCEGDEFSSLQHGNNLFRITVGHILSKRRSGENYPIYITDISLSPSVLGKEGGGGLQTTQLLLYKERIEQRLNRVLMA